MANSVLATAQLNISDVGDVKLEVSLGQVGRTHINFNDDLRRWTVLLSLDNIPGRYWPGRTMITSLRVYAVMAPGCALVFKAVHPHLSLGPIPMRDSKRNLYEPSALVTRLDPNEYMYLRAKIPVYPRTKIMNSSPALIRNITPKLYLPENSLPFSRPEALAASTSAW